MKFLAAIFISLAVCSAAMGQKALKPGNAAPAFAAESLDGNYYDLQAMRGQLVVVTFWSTKCEICRNEIPVLNKLMARYDESKVVFLAMSLETEEKLNTYLRSNQFKFHILPNSFGTLLQYADRDDEGNVDMGFPSYFLIDKSGNVAYRSSGWDRTTELENKISQFLVKN